MASPAAPVLSYLSTMLVKWVLVMAVLILLVGWINRSVRKSVKERKRKERVSEQLKFEIELAEARKSKKPRIVK